MSLMNGSSSQYRPCIDGLRAIAVLAVLLFHADLGFPGGYVGVDVFFVISGYLITGLILKDLDAGHFRIVEFWERRVRRILPALAVVVFTCLVAGWFLLFPQAFKELGESMVAQAMLLSNNYFWKKSWVDSGYFAPAAEVKPLLHTWSLGVEEQFYLLFPFVLIALNRFLRKSLTLAILLLGAISFSLSIYCSYSHPLANFYLLPMRAWELLIGSFLATIPTLRASVPWLAESLSWSGFLAILSAVFFYDRETRFPGVTAILPCVGAASIIWANSHTLTSVGKLLAARPVVFFGLISYSLYLWHWPMLVFPKYYALGSVPLNQRLLLLLASIVLAFMSWKFVENPFRKRSFLKSRSQIFAFAGSTTAVLLLTGLALFIYKGVPSRIPADALNYANGSADWAFRNEVGLKEALSGDFIELGIGDKTQQIDFLVWGDSHSMAVLPILDLLGKERSVRGVAATHHATAPLVGFESRGTFGRHDSSIPFNNAVVEFVRSKRVRDVVLVAIWGGYVAGSETARFHRSLIDTIRALQKSGARIWIMREVPKHRWDVPQALASAVFHGRNPEEVALPLAEHRKDIERLDPVFTGISAPGVTILDPTDLFVTSKNLCRVAENGKPLYWDKTHLTVAGAMVLRPLFEPLFEGIAKRDSSLKR